MKGEIELVTYHRMRMCASRKTHMFVVMSADEKSAGAGVIFEDGRCKERAADLVAGTASP